MSDWSTQHSRDTYNVTHWGGGYFDVSSRGHLTVHPDRSPERAIDLFELASRAQAEGLDLPLLVRFTGILTDRVGQLLNAFDEAIAEADYQGHFTAVYPIKVNQQRSVVERIIGGGPPGRVGLEAGSKPELLVVLAMVPQGGVVVCNGYKDREYIRLALIGTALGHRVYIVIEKLSELNLVLEEAEALGVTPLLGVRVRLASIGAGKWQNTGGEKSKFGLSASQILAVVERLQAAGRLDALKLLHFHLGSQIANIRDIQRGAREASRFYAELHRLGAQVAVVDVGGGLGVDYEGTRSRSFCSMNYSVHEYARNVVHALWEVCTESELPHPDIITESGRAMTAHHAVLITEVVDLDLAPDHESVAAPAPNDPIILHNLWEALADISDRSLVEAYHDAAHWLAEARTMFDHGVLTLEQRSHAEQLYFATCRKVRDRLQPSVRAHREILDELNEKLADKYFCNFSLFQSLPDAWGIDQIFPIMPLNRLDQPPLRRAVLQDMTCDSDGAVERYVDREGVETTLPVHALREDEPYLLGFFMVGAYQEILGDMHNLFGDTNSVDVLSDAQGGYRLEGAEHGDTVADLLRYVHFDPAALAAVYHSKVAAAADLPATLRDEWLAELKDGLTGYTYLEK